MLTLARPTGYQRAMTDERIIFLKQAIEEADDDYDTARQSEAASAKSALPRLSEARLMWRDKLAQELQAQAGGKDLVTPAQAAQRVLELLPELIRVAPPEIVAQIRACFD